MAAAEADVAAAEADVEAGRLGEQEAGATCSAGAHLVMKENASEKSLKINVRISRLSCSCHINFEMK